MNKFQKLIIKNLFTLLFLLGPGSAFAVPVQWTFQDVVFDDGGTLTGGFIFDVDSDTVVEQYFHPQEAWVQAFYFDVDIDATLGQQGSPFEAFYGEYSENYIGEVLVWGDPFIDPDNPPLPTADPGVLQNGVSLSTVQNCVVELCVRNLILAYAQPLTNAGGTVALSGYEEIYPFSLAGYFDRTIISGSLVGTTIVPIPAAVWLFGSGLGLLGWLRRRQTA